VSARNTPPKSGILRTLVGCQCEGSHEFCGSDEWGQMIRDVILPWALGEIDLGDDVLEVGPGYGATTDVLGAVAARLTSVEIDEELAAMLRKRFLDTPSVEIVNGDATHWPTRMEGSARRVSRCCTVFRGPTCKTGCSPRSPGCCGRERAQNATCGRRVACKHARSR
jgi:hypothetical protein